MERWSVAQGLALVSSCISQLQCFCCLPLLSLSIALLVFCSFFAVDCGWSSWTQWSACSRSCDVGVRRRYRSGTNPPAAFGGRPCIGDRVGIDTCSIEPCFGEPLTFCYCFKKNLIRKGKRKVRKLCSTQRCAGPMDRVVQVLSVLRRRLPVPNARANSGPRHCAAVQRLQPAALWYCKDIKLKSHVLHLNYTKEIMSKTK